MCSKVGYSAFLIPPTNTYGITQDHGAQKSIRSGAAMALFLNYHHAKKNHAARPLEIKGILGLHLYSANY